MKVLLNLKPYSFANSLSRRSRLRTLASKAMAESMRDEHVFLRKTNLTAGFTASPTTTGHALIHLTSPLFANKDETQNSLAAAKDVARKLCTVTSAKRCGLGYDGDRLIHIIPLHGLEEDWAAVLNHDEEYHEEFPGLLVNEEWPKAE